MHCRAEDSILIASLPIALTALRTKWTSISVAYLEMQGQRTGTDEKRLEKLAYSRNSARTTPMLSFDASMKINSSFVTFT